VFAVWIADTKSALERALPCHLFLLLTGDFVLFYPSVASGWRF
jgi:hypothetical protein